MTDRLSGAHPDSAALQLYADGEAQDQRIASHVESCAVCRAEVAAVRRVTAALSLSSVPPTSLGTRIQERRAAAAAAPVRLRHTHSRVRPFLLPAGLAAAAALVIFLPRAMREPAPNVEPSASGAKGAVPGGAVLFETLLAEASQSSLDSVVRALGDSGSVVEIRYVAGRAGSARAELLADSVAELLRERGVEQSIIAVRRESEDRAGVPPDGFVAVRVRGRLPSPR